MTATPPPTLKFQYVSDIHLEHYKIHKAADLLPTRWILPDPTADALVLAGDIGYPEKPGYGHFLRWCSENWPTVFVIAGNHEFYNEPRRSSEDTTPPPHSRYEKLEILRAICRTLSNVHFLDREVIEFRPGLWVAGCTLWSHIPEDMHKYAAEGVRDFQAIMATDYGAPVTLEEYAAWHKKDRDWLEGVLDDAAVRGDQVVVITHHLPTYRAIHLRYADYPLNCCFATALDELILVKKPSAWICGHSHMGATLQIGKTPLVLNPHGYPGERVESRSPQAILEVPWLRGATAVAPTGAQ